MVGDCRFPICANQSIVGFYMEAMAPSVIAHIPIPRVLVLPFACGAEFCDSAISRCMATSPCSSFAAVC